MTAFCRSEGPLQVGRVSSLMQEAATVSNRSPAPRATNPTINMAARPRIRRRANWPDNLHEPRPGYYTRRDPRDGKTHIPGRIDLALAIFEAQEVNRRQS
ncbi:hypothetical protein R69919_01848 [Paraburkholderia gardini]|nr:hypothetical protein R69919_01848 [Paraburkholderia gardini]